MLCLDLCFFQAEDGIRDLVRSRGFGDVYKRQAMPLTDRSFYLRTLDALIAYKKLNGDFQSALQLHEKSSIVRDSLYSWEKQKIQKNLEVQFDVSEKERLLKLAQRENEVARLTNYLLWAVIGFVLIIAIGIIFFLKPFFVSHPEYLQLQIVYKYCRQVLL